MQTTIRHHNSNDDIKEVDIKENSKLLSKISEIAHNEDIESNTLKSNYGK